MRSDSLKLARAAAAILRGKDGPVAVDDVIRLAEWLAGVPAVSSGFRVYPIVDQEVTITPCSVLPDWSVPPSASTRPATVPGPGAYPLALVADVLEWIGWEWAGTEVGPTTATLERLAALIRSPGLYEPGTLCPTCKAASCRDGCPLRPYRTPHHHGDCPAGCAMPPSRHLVYPGLLMERS